MHNSICTYIFSYIAIHFLEQTNYEIKEEVYSNDEDIQVDTYPEYESLHGTYS